jgi:tryptophan-rich sensory protein
MEPSAADEAQAFASRAGGWLAVTFAVSAFGALFTPGGGGGGWYATLPKPAWTPPAGFSARSGPSLHPHRGRGLARLARAGEPAGAAPPLAPWAVPLLLNGLWSLLFFGLRLVVPAFVEILVLWFAILATVITFWRVRPLAGALLIPYLAWVAFAAALNGAIAFAL